MRIVLASDWWPPRIGGVESQVFDLAQILVARGHDVSVITTTSAPSALGGGAVHHVQFPTVGAIAAPVPGVTSKIAACLREIAPDVVHAHGMFSSFAIGAVLAANRIGRPSVFTVHSLLRPAAVFAGATVLFRAWVNRADALTAVSAATAQDVQRASGRPAIHIPNGVNARFWSCDGSMRRNGRIRIAAVTRLVPKKRPVELIRALAAARRTSRDVVLDLVGDGRSRRAVEISAERLGVRDRVVFHGACSREHVRDVLCQASFAALAGTREAFGLSILEARAAGLPVVAVRAGGAPELIEHGRNGLLARGHQEFHKLVALMSADDDLRSQCAQNAPYGLERYDWPQVIVEHERVYECAIGSRQTRGRQVKNRIAATI